MLSQVERQYRVELAQAMKTLSNKEDEGQLGLAAPPPPKGLDSRTDKRDGWRKTLDATLKINSRSELK